MAAVKKTLITSDDLAVKLLKEALENELGDDAVLFDFSAWPTVDIELKGPHYNGTITAATAQALIEYQRAIEHAYMRLVKPSAKRLSAEEKRQIAIKAKVEKGSTFLTIDFNAALTEISQQLIGKMSPSDIIITVLGLGMIAGGSVVAKAYFKERSARLIKDKELAQQLSLSGEETKRLEVVTRAMTKQTKLAVTKEDFDDARDVVLRSAADSTSLTFEGIQLTPAQAASLAREPRTNSVEVQLNGTYSIVGVTWTDDEEVSLDLRGTDQSLEFKATLSTMSLMPKDKKLLADAEWSRTPVYLSINGKKLRDEVVKATVVGFDWEKLRLAPTGKTV